MKKQYLSFLTFIAMSLGVNAQLQMNQITTVPNGPPSAFGGNCNVVNMVSSVASGSLSWIAGDAELYTWFDISGSPGCGLGYPFTLTQVDLGIADPAGFGQGPGSGTGTLTYKVNIYDAVTPGDPCTEPGALIATSGNQTAVYADEGLHSESVTFNEVLTTGFFVAWEFVSWTGPAPDVPSPVWDADPRPLCRQWVTNDGGTTLMDFTDFFIDGDMGWVDVTIDGSGTAGGGPPNDDCTGAVNQALNAGGSITFNGDNTGATDDGQGLGTAQVWEMFTTTECLDIVLDYCGTTPAFGNGFQNLFDGCPYNLFEAPDSFNATDCGDNNFTLYYTDVPAGTWYYPVMLDPGNNAEGPYTINVSGTACAGGPVNNSPNLEGFEGAGFPPPCWMLLDEDGDGQEWFSYQVAGVAHTGDSCAASASWNTNPLNPDNYLILPQVTPGVDEHLTYWVAAQDPAYAAENYSVVLSTTGTAASDFSTTLFTETLVDDVWQERTVDLSAYMGQNIYLAFRHHGVSDEFIIKIDDVQFPTETNPCGGMVNMSPNFEGFEGADFPPQCWTNLDEDGDGEMWFRDGTPGVAPHMGDSCAVSASWLNSVILFPENYLILPQVTPGVDEHLTYWVAAQDPAYAAEHYGIVVSTTGMAAADFSTELFSETLVDDVWVERTVDLSNFQGMDIYIAFKHYNVSDQFWMKIDDVQWPTETMPCIPTSINETSSSVLSMFPNPSSGNVMIQSNDEVITSLEIVDISGRMVRSVKVNNTQYILERNDLVNGVYFVNIHLGSSIITQKLIFE